MMYGHHYYADRYENGDLHEDDPNGDTYKANDWQ